VADPQEHSQAIDPVPGSAKRFSWLGPSSVNLPQRFLFAWLWSMPLTGILGLGVILIYVSQVSSGIRWAAFGTAVVIAASAWFGGGIAGFLFGIPRTVQGRSSSDRAIHYQGNTNLEQVSDWLTKIIVGVGLVQIGHIVPALSKFAQSVKAPLGGLPSSAAFGLGLAISYSLLGFFYFYFWSRSLFARELGTYDAPSAERDK
jgi:hypothetical protein